MDFIKEIWGLSLPNFGYVIERDNGKLSFVVLGGQSIEKTTEYRFLSRMIDINTNMQAIYSQDVLTEEDKIELAKLMKKMFIVCDSRIEGFYTKSEQEAFINTLSSTEKAQLEYQINMLKDCRKFHAKYIYR